MAGSATSRVLAKTLELVVRSLESSSNWHDEDKCRVLFNCGDAEEGELLACLEALRLAVQWIVPPIILESDWLSVVNALNSRQPDRSRLSLLLAEVKSLVDELKEIERPPTHRGKLGTATASEVGYNTASWCCKAIVVVVATRVEDGRCCVAVGELKNAC
ncbi:hypothetical protein EJB05_31283, partial [Eragrostis curvula]